MNLKDMKINSVKNIINRKWLILSLYVGLVSFNVPSILCYADSSSVLTYEKIYNNTNYPQVKYKTRTFQQQIRESDKNKKESLEEENNLEFNFESDDENKNALLVAYSHDPYRNSMLESDYVKGIGLSKPQYYSKGDRDKRGVAHLYNMIYCATGCDPISYKGYGCYCGFLGAGRPMDGIDKCCQMHDRCYETLFCPFFTVYFQPYYWKCYRGQPLCALENYETRNQYINGCASKLCECDRRFAMCLQKYRCPRRRALCTSQPLRLLQNLLMFP